MCVRFSLPNGHRSAALEGQHRDREAQEQSEEQTHHVSMVPQIKSVHQGAASWAIRMRHRGAPRHGLHRGRAAQWRAASCAD
jgi:hypothetical protein